MFTLVEAKNFKCFGEHGARLDLAPLTILVGPNGSGKSSLLDAVALLAQTAAKSSGGAFSWKGFWVDLGGDGSYAFHKRDAAARLTLAVGLLNGRALADWQRERNLFGQLSVKPTKLEYLVQYSSRSDEWLHRLIADDEPLAERQTILDTQQFWTKQYKHVVRYPAVVGASQVEFTPTTSPGGVLSSSLFMGSTNVSIGSEDAKGVSALNQELQVLLEYMSYTLANRVFLVGAGRAPRQAELKRVENFRVGRGGEYTLELLSTIFAQPEYGAQAEKIRQWAGVFGLEKLSGGWAGEQELQSGFYDSKSQTPLPTQYAGFGSQQLLPVIAQIFSAPRGSLIMVEEPEISLHPEAQIDLVRMFADAIHAGQQILITTHSQTLLLALSAAAKEYGLKPEAVSIYHFSREKEETEARRLELDSNWYVKGWVPSFSEVESRLIKQWSVNVRDKIGSES